MDVKVVPKDCYTGTIPDKFYQYTVIDEASRERFIYPYKEQSSYSTIDFVKRAIVYFGYKPRIIQTDNGTEFTHTRKTDKLHPLDTLLKSLDIQHKLIRPRPLDIMVRLKDHTEMTNKDFIHILNSTRIMIY